LAHAFDAAGQDHRRFTELNVLGAGDRRLNA
jgi:hypothetical protein